MMKSISGLKRTVPALLSLLALTTGLAAGLDPEARTVKGVVLDTRGKPIQGAIVRIEPTLSGGMVSARTDAQGRYSASSLIDQPYAATAWILMPYRGQKFCLRIDSANEAGYEPFSGRAGAVRNFKLKLSGPIADPRGDWSFGGEVGLLHPGWDEDGVVNFRTSRVEVTLVPVGPLVDGSPGKTLVRTTQAEESLLYDVPLGHYTATAVEIGEDGTRVPLLMGKERPNPKMDLDFNPSTSYCGTGYSSVSGIGRAFLYVARPAR